MQFIIEDDGVSKKIVYCVADVGRLDFYAYEMLCVNEIRGVIGLLYTERNGMDAVMYDVTRYDTLRNYLSFSITLENLLSVFIQIIAIVEEIEDYLLDNSLLITDIGQIFYDRTEEKVQMIYFPVSEGGDYRTCDEKLFTLFREIIFSAKFVVGNEDRYITEILNGMSDIKEFTLAEFKEVVYGLAQKIGADYLIVTKECENEKEKQEESDVCMVCESVVEYDVNGSMNDYEERGKKGGIRSFVRKLFYKEEETVEISEEVYEVPDEMEEDTVVEAEIIDENNETVVLVRGECGVYSPYIVRTSTGDRIDITRRVFKIGKDKRYADYIIGDNAAISRAHAEFMIKDGAIYITDEDSLNGTYVNGEKLTSRQEKELKNGDVISFADEEFMLYC